MTKLLHQELTYAIIGAAMEVHSVLGPGFLEAVYQAALARELHLRNIPHQQQSGLEVLYKDIIAGTYRADFLVDDKVILELKAVKVLTDLDEAQLINYLKGTGYRVGLLLNFGTSSLERVRRIV